jgi:hypothetical protein
MALVGGSAPAGGAIAAHFQATHDDVEPAFTLDLSLEAIEKVTFEFRDFATTQTSHVDMVTLRTPLVKMLFALHMHQVEFVHQAVTFQQVQGAINSDAINLRIQLPRLPQYLAGIQVLLGGFYDAKNRAPLMSHSQSAGHEFGL